MTTILPIYSNATVCEGMLGITRIVIIGVIVATIVIVAVVGITMFRITVAIAS